jgi:hypothetical protein
MKPEDKAVVQQALESVWGEPDHADELTIAYLDGVHTGKQIAKRDLLKALERLLVVQDELCSIDHHGYCQSHYLDNVNSYGGCRVANARSLVAKVRGTP